MVARHPPTSRISKYFQSGPPQKFGSNFINLVIAYEGDWPRRGALQEEALKFDN
jgi:hypothetical protein